MIGPEGAGAITAAWLLSRLPARLAIIEARLELEPGSLATPSLVEDHETGPIALEEWPAVYVLPQRVTDVRLIEHADGAEDYRVTYAVRILMWVRATSHGDTDLLRKRYALATREALLERKQLSPPPGYLEPGYGDDTSIVTVNPATIREDYSGLVDTDSAATIAGAWLDVELAFTETLEGAEPLGQAATIELSETGDTAGIPLHPGL